jgi:hypothetical protein
MAPRGQYKQKWKRRKATPQELAKKATARETKKKTSEQKKKVESQAKKKAALASWKSQYCQATNEDAADHGSGDRDNGGDDGPNSGEGSGNQHNETDNDANDVDVQDMVDKATEDSAIEEDYALGTDKEMTDEEMADEYNDFVFLDDEEDVIPAEGLMKLILIHVQSQLQKETTGDSKEILPIDCWLSRHLQQNDFWILKSSLKKITRKLGIMSHFDDSYYL